MRRTVKTTIATVVEWVDNAPLVHDVTIAKVDGKDANEIAKKVCKALGRIVTVVATREEKHCYTLADEIFFKYAVINDDLLGKDDEEQTDDEQTEDEE